MRSFLLALSLLTVLPLHPQGAEEEEFRQSTLFFPLVGYLIGAGLLLLSLLPLPEGLLGALLLAFWLGMTGFLHLDGLLDLADALLGAKPREARLRILKDPHLGAFAFGVGGVYLLLLWQALALGPPGPMLLLLPGFARGVILPFLNRYPLLGPGLAAAIRGGPVLPPLLLTLPFPLLYPFPALLGLLGAWGLARLALARLGGINGDILGGMILLTELFALVGYALWKALSG